MTLRLRFKVTGAIAALLILALLTDRASPGFPLAKVGSVVKQAIHQTLQPNRAQAAPAAVDATARASGFALSDIPTRYLGLYIQAAQTCPALTWQLLAGIGKVETNHGRANLPGVRSGVNTYGCCAGPMQFNIRNGPPSTWDAYNPRRGNGNVYNPADAIPAAAHKLCTDGLNNPTSVQRDPCPNVLGTPAQHQAIYAYNHACWYAHQVLTLATRYTTQTPVPADPFTKALAHNPHLLTTPTHGCNPQADLTNPQLDLRIQSLLTVLAGQWTIRLSCIHTGHTHNVAGTNRTSNHTLWRAVDIDQINHHPIRPNDPRTRALMTWLDHLQGPLRPSEIGGPLKINHRPYFTNEGHQHHIHIGYDSSL